MAGGTAHTSYICPAPINPANGFWLYQFIGVISSEGVHCAQASFVDNDQSVVVEPATRESEQALAVIRAGKFLTQDPDERAAVVIGEPLKPECVARELLMLDQRWFPAELAPQGSMLDSLTTACESLALTLPSILPVTDFVERPHIPEPNIAVARTR
jgi:hypothetical protein